ncbi:hypothetical protein AB0E59_07560 [Lentzea sp. NPDC034063]|uniref:hypothetical protein n=1 Tax=unclassified Lentzea TaxID=2643253 RepID=UPI0033C1FFC3
MPPRTISRSEATTTSHRLVQQVKPIGIANCHGSKLGVVGELEDEHFVVGHERPARRWRELHAARRAWLA